MPDRPNTFRLLLDLSQHNELTSNHFRELFAELFDAVQGVVTDSRERSLALTQLETAWFWLELAITKPKL